MSTACDQCATPVIGLSVCVDCDDDLCTDCVMVDPKTDEQVCESCLADREVQESADTHTLGDFRLILCHRCLDACLVTGDEWLCYDCRKVREDQDADDV